VAGARERIPFGDGMFCIGCRTLPGSHRQKLVGHANAVLGGRPMNFGELMKEADRQQIIWHCEYLQLTKQEDG